MNRRNEVNEDMETRLNAFYGSTRVDGDKARAWIDKGIHMAKNKNRRWLKHGLTMITTVVVFVVCVNVFPGFNHVFANVPIIGTLADVITITTYTDETDHISLLVEAPSINERKMVQANQDIDEYVQGLIDQYQLDTEGSVGNYDLISHYSVVTDNGQYLSIRFDTNIVMAGATQTVRTFTIDKATGSVVSLFDVLDHDQNRLNQISENIKSQMIQRMADDPTQQYWVDSDVSEWNFDGLDGDESFYFDEDKQLVIEFDELDVAPGYMGVVSFTIPLEVSGELIHG